MEGQVTDALHRFCRGAQSWDRDLLVSALSADAELDPRAATMAWSARAPRLIGRDTVADILLGIFQGRVHTTYAITDSAIVVDGSRAWLRALVDMRHRLLADAGVGANLTYRCTTELVSADSRWVLRRIGVETVRFRGAPAEIYCRGPVERPQPPSYRPLSRRNKRCSSNFLSARQLTASFPASISTLCIRCIRD